MNSWPIIQTIALFILAGLAEIAGGWLIWEAVRDGKPWSWAFWGGVLLVVYGFIPTLQFEPAFGRVYAAYGGVFISLSILWAIRFDGFQPDRFDWIGAAVALIGVAIILWGRQLA